MCRGGWGVRSGECACWGVCVWSEGWGVCMLGGSV